MTGSQSEGLRRIFDHFASRARRRRERPTHHRRVERAAAAAAARAELVADRHIRTANKSSFTEPIVSRLSGAATTFDIDWKDKLGANHSGAAAAVPRAAAA